MISQIFKQYSAYLKIPSLTHSEDKLASKLVEDFGAEMIENCPVWMGNPKSDFLFMCHMDRIRVEPMAPVLERTGIVPYIQGQLDDSICIAIFKVLKVQGQKFNIMFTREEEICHAQKYVIKICDIVSKQHNKKYQVIDCDIDVFYKNDEWINSISLRTHDNVSPFSDDLVSKFQFWADSSRINFSQKEDWLVGTIGLVRKQAPDIKGLYLGLPILEYHTNHEVVALDTLTAYYRMLSILVKEPEASWNRFQRQIDMETALTATGDFGEL